LLDVPHFSKGRPPQPRCRVLRHRPEWCSIYLRGWDNCRSYLAQSLGLKRPVSRRSSLYFPSIGRRPYCASESTFALYTLIDDISARGCFPVRPALAQVGRAMTEWLMPITRPGVTQRGAAAAFQSKPKSPVGGTPYKLPRGWSQDVRGGCLGKLAAVVGNHLLLKAKRFPNKHRGGWFGNRCLLLSPEKIHSGGVTRPAAGGRLLFGSRRVVPGALPPVMWFFRGRSNLCLRLPCSGVSLIQSGMYLELGGVSSTGSGGGGS